MINNATTDIDDFSAYVRQRIARNKNFLCVITGETGSGKSYTALSLAASLSPRFSDKNVCFTPLQFLQLIKSKDLQSGDCIVFDEAGVGMSARAWTTIQNRLLGLCLQVFRHKNLIVIFTVPHISFIDVMARRLFHYVLETRRIDYKTKKVDLKLFAIKSTRDGKVWLSPPKVSTGGEIIYVNGILIPIPPENLRESYELRKEEYAENLYNSSFETIETLEKSEKLRKLKIEKGLRNFDENSDL